MAHAQQVIIKNYDYCYHDSIILNSRPEIEDKEKSLGS